MKFLVNIVLFLFVSFLAAPTVVSLIQDEADVSMVYSLTEEEIQKEIKEVKAAPQCMLGVAFFIQSKKKTVIKSANLQKHDNLAGEIFSPPPEITI
jgi:pantoate kinase